MTEPKPKCWCQDAKHFLADVETQRRGAAEVQAQQQATERAALIASKFQELEHKACQLRAHHELIKQSKETAPPTVDPVAHPNAVNPAALELRVTTELYNKVPTMSVSELVAVLDLVRSNERRELNQKNLQLQQQIIELESALQEEVTK